MAPRDPQKTQARLLDAAEREFAARGFAGARVAAIARAARANQRMIYHYFGNKQGLYQAVFERRGRTAMEGMLRQLAGGSKGDPIAAYRRALGLYFDLFARNPTWARMSANEALGGFTRAIPADDPQARFIAETIPFIQQAVAEGLFRDPIGPFAGFTYAGFLGLCFVLYRKRIEDGVRRLGRDEPDLLAAYRESTLDAILHGLLRQTARD